MKTKKIFTYTALCALAISPISIKAEKEGGLGGGGLEISAFRAVSFISPISVSASYSSIFVCFQASDLGMVNVTILDQNGSIVYRGAVNTSAQSELEINTAGDQETTYSILITDDAGNTIAEETAWLY